MLKTARKFKNEKGTTLIELLAAVAIFAITMNLSAGIFINAIKDHRKIIAKQDVLDNGRYTMEFMIKELRMAKANSTPTLTFQDGSGNPLVSPANPVSNSISFINFVGHTIKYSYDTANGRIIMRDIYTDPITFITTDTGDQPISANNIRVNSLSFKINDWNLTPGPLGKYPLISIFMTVQKMSGTSHEATLNLQSTVSPRLY